ncbi:hypothetical protein PSD17_20120 [Pseudonocardia sp. D17]|nr:hypothetical protein PSD17_20120 [Pseudonocardia sp. D17]
MTGLTKKKVFAQLKDTVEQIESSTSEIDRLAAGRTLRLLADQLERDLVTEARAAGVRWADIGELYGTSKQSVQQRFRARPTTAAD